MKSKRSKACDIPEEVRLKVMERDMGRCILCGSTYWLTLAHYVSRANGGLGIEQNLVCLCQHCHYETDQSIKRKYNLAVIKGYLKSFYPDWSEDKIKYKKGG